MKGFRNGFSIGYNGPENVKLDSPNLKLNVGNETILWNKVMKEVQKGRYVGPFKMPPYKNYIQSPIGLVPKDNGRDVRLIFHLSYPQNLRPGQPTSLNANMPKHLCSVKYYDFDAAVRLCAETGRLCTIKKSDMASAFRNLGILRKHWKVFIDACKVPKKW